MIESQNTPRVYSLEATVKTQLGSVNLSVTRYTNSLVLIINELGTIGSMLQGVLEGKGEEDIFEIKTLFGATSIVFYEVLFRRILENVFKLCRVSAEQPFIVTMFVALPVNRQNFPEKEYYTLLVEQLEKDIPTLFPQH